MDELQLISHQRPGNIAIDNLPELKAALAAFIARYQNIVYTESTLADAKTDKRELSRLRKELDERRKEIKRAYLAPYNEFDAQVKELLAMVDTPLEQIKTFIAGMDEQEKQAKRSVIEAYFFGHNGALD